MLFKNQQYIKMDPIHFLNTCSQCDIQYFQLQNLSIEPMFEKYRGGLRKREKKKEDWAEFTFSFTLHLNCPRSDFQFFHSNSHISFSSCFFFCFVLIHFPEHDENRAEREREWKMSNEAEEQLSSSTWWKWLLTGGAAHLHPPLFLFSHPSLLILPIKTYTEHTCNGTPQFIGAPGDPWDATPPTWSDIMRKHLYHWQRHCFKTMVITDTNLL